MRSLPFATLPKRTLRPLADYLNYQFESVKNEIRVQTSAHHQQVVQAVNRDLAEVQPRLYELEALGANTEAEVRALQRRIAELDDRLTELQLTNDRLVAIVAEQYTEPATAASR